jgi:protein-tyrosine phosphatase
MIALGIGVAGAGCAALAVETSGLARIAWAWTSGACAVATTAYLLNRPAWLGKRAGRLTPASVLLLPYLVAVRIAFALIRRSRPADAPTEVSPGLWVGGRVDARSFPPGVTHVVDLVAEYAAPAWERALPGYRPLLVLDGGQPPDPRAFLDLVHELRDVTGVLVHCDSGRGRAPTMAAAILLARGLAPDVVGAFALLRERRPVTSPTRVDVAFLEAVWPELRRLRRSRDAREATLASRVAADPVERANPFEHRGM